MKSLFHSTIILLTCVQVLYSQETVPKPSSPSDPGAIILPAPPPVKDAPKLTPEERFQIERERIIKQGKIPLPEIDFSGVSTPELLNNYLRRSDDYAGTREFSELQRRSEEVKDEILKRLDHLPENVFQAPNQYRETAPDDECRNHIDRVFSLLQKYDANRLPQAAGAVSSEFQVYVAKVCLFHPPYRVVDSYAIRSQSVFRSLAVSKYDESAVLDRLIAEGRLEKGSPLEVTWRQEFSKKPKRSRPERREDFVGSDSHPSSEGSPHGETASGSRSSNSIWPYLGAGLLLLIAAGFWYLRRK